MKIKTIGKMKSLAMFLLIALALGGNFAQAQASTVKVTILKYVDGSVATAASAHNSNFLMNASWNASNLGGAGSGQYSLSASGYNGDPTPYQAVTVDLASGSSYSTSEVMDGAVVGASCGSHEDDNPMFRLSGYTYGDSLVEASSSAKSSTAPNLTNITSDKYVIVWNNTCDLEGNVHHGNNGNGKLNGVVTGGQNNDNGNLKVTSVEAVNTTATADGTFENGFVYTFNITVPSDESHLSMKFADWMKTGGGGVIPAADNVRISSLQADNSDAPVLITAANTYSSPTLHMVTDLDSSTPGIQVQVKVEVAVPSSTPNGHYTTSYGVKTI